MNQQIHLLRYNNYFNRQIKIDGSTHAAYVDYIVYSAEVNFNPNDGITAELILNTSEPADYMIVMQKDDSSEVESRWFVLEQERTRAGQYKISLKRDVIADNVDTVMHSPCYVEKGTLNENDPMIFNDEGMKFNQIKKKEIFLKDRSQTPWIVGYINRKYDEQDKSITAQYNVLQSAAIDSSALP